MTKRELLRLQQEAEQSRWKKQAEKQAQEAANQKSSAVVSRLDNGTYAAKSGVQKALAGQIRNKKSALIAARLENAKTSTRGSGFTGGSGFGSGKNTSWKKYDLGSTILDTVNYGAGLFVSPVATALDIGANIVVDPLLDAIGFVEQKDPEETLVGKGLKSITDATAAFSDWTKRETQGSRERALADASGSKLGTAAVELGAGVVGALPNAALAMLSGGASVGAQLASQGSGIAGTAANAIRSVAQSPMAKISLIQNVGREFDAAKEGGATDAEALSAAILAGALNTAVETSGGVETLPGALKERKLSGGEKLARWAGSALSEGLEEPVQSLVSGSVAKGVYAPEKEFYSSADENAVIHPGRMLREAGYGMAVGGILSGGEVAGDILQRIDLSRVATNDARKVKDLSVASSLQIKTFIHNSFQKKNEYQYLSVGKASSQLVADMQTVGVNIAGYDHAIRDNDLRHIRRSHGDLSNDKYKVSEADLEKIPEIIENYDVLYLGYRTKDGNQAIAYEKTIDQKVFYVEEVLEDGVLGTKQMLKTGIASKPSFLKKYKKVTSASPDTDVPLKAKSTGRSPPGNHVQDARLYTGYDGSLASFSGSVNGNEGMNRYAWQVPVWPAGDLTAVVHAQAELLRQAYAESLRTQQEEELDRAFLRGFNLEK